MQKTLNNHFTRHKLFAVCAPSMAQAIFWNEYTQIIQRVQIPYRQVGEAD